MRPYVFVAGALLLASSGRVTAADAQPKPTTTTVRGGWVGVLPCVPLPGTTLTGTRLHLRCVSGTAWDGAWSGQTSYVVTADTDLVTGNTKGTIDETLTGIDTATQRPGTLHLNGSLQVDGATNTIQVEESIIDGTGAFSHLSGHATFEGVQVSGAAGHGGYHAEIRAGGMPKS